MKKITLKPPHEGRVVSVPLMQSKVFTVSGDFEADDADTVSITVTVDGRVSIASVDTNQGKFQAAITLTCPSVVAVKAILYTKQWVEKPPHHGSWEESSIDSNIVTLTVQDAPTDPQFHILCRCVDSGGRPLVGMQIEAFDQDPMSPDDRLGATATTDVDGLAKFEFRESTFSEHPGEHLPDVYFRVTRRGNTFSYNLPGQPNDHGVLRNFQPNYMPVTIHVPDLRGYVVKNAIRAKWLNLGAQNGFLGLPITDELLTPDRRGLYNHFEGGSIYWNPEWHWGAFEVHGEIRQKWAELGWEQSFLGFPVTDTLPMPGDNGGRYGLFEHGIIIWDPGQAEAMAGPHHYERIYAQVRAQILSRFFAIGSHGRRNLPCNQNQIGGPLKPNPTTPEERKEDERARWRIVQAEGENPHMVGAMLHVALAVEHNAGNEESGRVLEASLATLDTLFTWREPGAEGTSRLPTRWDAGLIMSAPDTRQFLDGGDGAYANALPASNLHHYAFRNPEILKKLLGPKEAHQYTVNYFFYCKDFEWTPGGRGIRRWELSQDELTGLVTSYWIIGKLSRSSRITDAVRRQASFLGNYLANNGYILVRPMGGLSWRGAAGALPAMEYPFSRALSSVTGENFASRTDFRGAMIRAGHWPMLEAPIAYGKTLVGIGLPWVLSILGPLAPILGLTVADVQEILTGQVISHDTLASSLGIYFGLDPKDPLIGGSVGFDVCDEKAQGEIAIALLFKDAPNKAGLYRALAIMQAAHAKYNSWSVNFHAWIGLTGVDDPDGTVRDAFTGWFDLRQSQPLEMEPNGVGSRMLFTAGVRVLVMNDIRAEEFLVARLERGIVEQFRNSYFEPRLPTWESEGLYYENCESALNLMAATALAFWHARRRADAGNPVNTPRFPQPLSAGSFAHWPKVVIPAYCLTELQNAGIPLPMEQDIPGLKPFNPPISPDLPDIKPNVGDYALFDPPVEPRNPAPAPPPWEIADRVLYDDVIPVRADYPGEVATGVILYPGCEIEISADGDIWSGRPLDPRNGPEGLPQRPIHDARWPLHTGIDPAANAYCLLGRLNGYFRIGSGLPKKTRWVYFQERPLFLRINHVAPGYGNGQFNVHIKVWGPARMDPLEVFPPRQSIFQVGGVLRTIDPKDLIDVAVEKGKVADDAVEKGKVADDAVEFVLTTPDGITWRKEIDIGYNPTTGGSVKIWTQDDKHEDRNGLYVNELPGATLTFRKEMGGGRGIRPMLVLGGLDSALAGSRIIFNWYYD